MSSESQKIKRRLLNEYEELIEQMLREKPETEEIQLRDIEQAAIRVGESAKRQIVQALSEEGHEEVRDCPACGKRMWLKDYRQKQVVTEAGEIRLKRAYYYCQTCRKGLFPPG